MSAEVLLLAADLSTVVVVAVTAVLTAAVTAVIGFGGGIVLLAVLVSVLEPGEAIPVHAGIQLASNGARARTYRAVVEWPIVKWMSLPLIATVPVGLLIADATPRAAGRLLIGLFVMLAMIKPWERFGWVTPPAVPPTDGDRLSPRRWLPLGAANGVLLPSVGATGVMLAPFLRGALPDRAPFVGTFAAQQVLAHLSKIIAFTAAGFAFADQVVLMVIGVVGVVAGTALGTRFGDRLSEVAFNRIYYVGLTVVAVRLIVLSVRDLVA